ncbi:MAG TPA: saccharopine dehydrogenase, partial [Cytophagales bacterium]|nr:saccharopine dehydrogenase [Cytophagales bacterium]
MQRVLLLGAGRSAASLIHYLVKHASEHNWHISIGDYNPEVAKELVEESSQVRIFKFDVNSEEQRVDEVRAVDVVISLLPARFHIYVAEACLKMKKPMFTASYIADDMQALEGKIREAGLFFLMECGLDPGIDHMTAMQSIHSIQARGGQLFSFKSYAGGLLAPQSEDNPWRYKFTWNPRNVVLAGQGTAQFIRNGRYKYIPYHDLFTRLEPIQIPGYGDFEAYPNRDSLRYRKVYNLADIPTMLRGTMRRPGFSAAWHLLVKLGLTEDGYTLEGSEEMTYREFVNSFLAYDVQRTVEEKLCSYLGVTQEEEAFQKLVWIGLFENEPIGLPNATPAQVLQKRLEERWRFGQEDRDMIVMHHQFGYLLDGKPHCMEASLATVGQEPGHTGM